MKTDNKAFVLLFLGKLIFLLASPSTGFGQSDLVEPDNSISHYRNRVQQLEIAGGAHNGELATPLVSLGALLQENGQYSEAADILGRALYVHRINNGLYNLAQLPILELLIDNNIAQKNWHETNKNFHLFDWLHRRNYDKTDPRMLAVVDKLTTWHLAAANLNAVAHPGQHFLKLMELNQTAIDIVEHNTEQDTLSLARRLYKLALTHYYISVAVQRSEHIGMDLVLELAPLARRDSYDEAIEKIVRKSYLQSRKLLERIIALYISERGSSEENKAIALLYLADWDLLYGRRGNAKHFYHQAYNKLVSSGHSQTSVNSFFLQPKLLPKSEFIPDLMTQYESSMGYSPKTGTPGDARNDSVQFIGWSTSLPGIKFPVSDVKDIVTPNTERFSLVSFDVLKNGLADNIRVLKQKQNHGIPRSTTYNAIWSAQFRPRLENGKPVSAPGILVRYYFPDTDH